jgi:phosphoribosylformylglycinamidine synthase
MRVRIEVHLKKGVTDPEGDNVLKALNLLGFKGIRGVHSAKLFLVDLEAKDAEAARASAEDMCRRLLANPVVHNYTIVVESRAAAAPAPWATRAVNKSR